MDTLPTKTAATTAIRDILVLMEGVLRTFELLG
jgi:hypothetical protein